jgi:tryptophanyl-tRNA synthetase
MLERLADIHARRPEYAARPDTVWDVLYDGSKRARAVAQATMDDVRSAMKIRYDRTPA